MLTQDKNAKRGTVGAGQEIKGCLMQSKNWLKGEQGWNSANGTHEEQNIRLRKQDKSVRNKMEEDRIGSRTTKQKSGSGFSVRESISLVRT